MNLSFVGCGFLGTYHLGVAACFKAYAPHVLVNKTSGSSAGSVVAAIVLVDAPLNELAEDLLKGTVEARKNILGPFSPSFDMGMLIGQSLDRLFPEDAHLKVNGKLHLSLTNIYDGKNILVSKYSSREELINVVLASCFVPVLSGIVPPRFRGSKVIDGFYSNNLPVLDSQTITVSPFCGAADICPQDHDLEDAYMVKLSNMGIETSKQNAMRMFNVLLPPDAEALSMYCKQGYNDALRFLQQRKTISCNQCMHVASTLGKEEEVHDSPLVKKDSGCCECLTEKKEIRGIEIRNSVLEVLKTKSAENSFTNSLLRILFYSVLLYFSGLLVQVLITGRFDWCLDFIQF